MHAQNQSMNVSALGGGESKGVAIADGKGDGHGKIGIHRRGTFGERGRRDTFGEQGRRNTGLGGRRDSPGRRSIGGAHRPSTTPWARRPSAR